MTETAALNSLLSGCFDGQSEIFRNPGVPGSMRIVKYLSSALRYRNDFPIRGIGLLAYVRPVFENHCQTHLSPRQHRGWVPSPAQGLHDGGFSAGSIRLPYGHVAVVPELCRLLGLPQLPNRTASRSRFLVPAAVVAWQGQSLTFCLFSHQNLLVAGSPAHKDWILAQITSPAGAFQ